ncbi:MAG TPA: methyltransferase domain-containing protein [Steroidobacteraceae bacterium]|nr:methyltransferase domain-containing protein [Steroidobacteraceae bacterium]HRX88193.1 methyltransferase domain-containing protein [Steroidobacteraceae bacterium]
MLELKHDLRLATTRDEQARMNFVSGLRSYVLNDMASGMRAAYDKDVEPAFRRDKRRAPKDGPEVHKAIRSNEYFKFYSSLRVTAQDMVWQSVFPPLERQRGDLKQRAQKLAGSRKLGSLKLDPSLPVPRSVSALDVHLMPGNYDGEYESGDLAAGALYDNGLAVFSFGLMGQNLDDIGQSISRFIKARYPKFKPARILDLGCTIGHNTGSWKDTYPDAQVIGIDVAAPCLRYAHARAQAQSRAVDFEQMNATELRYPDASFDVVFSSMFLHEVPRKDISRVIAEAHRVLKPGGLMLHMELPPNAQLSPYDAFYLDWDSSYNNEPYYKPFRDLVPQLVCKEAGFKSANYVQFVVPSIAWFGEQAVAEAVARQGQVDSDKTGRLADGLQWYCFGAWR